MSDLIVIEGLETEAVIGVYDWERTIRQRLVFDVEIPLDVTGAAASDQLKDTVDYKVVSDRLIEYVSASQFELVEALAESLAQLLIQEFGLKKLRLRVSKPGAVAQAKNVTLVIERSAENLRG